MADKRPSFKTNALKAKPKKFCRTYSLHTSTHVCHYWLKLSRIILIPCSRRELGWSPACLSSTFKYNEDCLKITNFYHVIFPTNNNAKIFLSVHFWTISPPHLQRYIYIILSHDGSHYDSSHNPSRYWANISSACCKQAHICTFLSLHRDENT